MLYRLGECSSSLGAPNNQRTDHTHGRLPHSLTGPSFGRLPHSLGAPGEDAPASLKALVDEHGRLDRGVDGADGWEGRQSHHKAGDDVVPARAGLGGSVRNDVVPTRTGVRGECEE